MAESLRQKQSRFARMTAQLINHATILGYEITFAHAYRSQDEAKRLGFSKSLHCQRLAIDLNLFKNGRYLTSTKAHTPLGCTGSLSAALGADVSTTAITTHSSTGASNEPEMGNT